MHAIFPTSNILLHNGIFIRVDEPTHHCHPKFKFVLVFTFSFIHSMGFDECIMTFINNCGIIHISFTALKKNQLCSTYLSQLPPSPWQPLITVSIDFPFPEHHRVGII